jgi:hypothetical protein
MRASRGGSAGATGRGGGAIFPEFKSGENCSLLAPAFKNNEGVCIIHTENV